MLNRDQLLFRKAVQYIQQRKCNDHCSRKCRHSCTDGPDYMLFPLHYHSSHPKTSSPLLQAVYSTGTKYYPTLLYDTFKNNFRLGSKWKRWGKESESCNSHLITDSQITCFHTRRFHLRKYGVCWSSYKAFPLCAVKKINIMFSISQ